MRISLEHHLFSYLDDSIRGSPSEHHPLSLMTLYRGSLSLRVSDVGVILSKSYKKIGVSEFAVVGAFVGGVRCGCHTSFKFTQVGCPLVIHPSSYQVGGSLLEFMVVGSLHSSSYKSVVRSQVHTSWWRGGRHPSFKFIQVGGSMVESVVVGIFIQVHTSWWFVGHSSKFIQVGGSLVGLVGGFGWRCLVLR